MSKATQAYGEKVRAHLEESFPGDGPPPLVNIIDADWHAAVFSKVPPPKGMSDVDAYTTIGDVIIAWLTDGGFESIGTIYRHPERHAAQQAAEAEEARLKSEQEIAPMLAVMKRAVTEVMVESGLLQMKPTAVVQPGHSRKRGPGRGRN